MIWCVDNPDAVEECGRNGREVAEAEYSWDAIADQTFDLYRELITNKED